MLGIGLEIGGLSIGNEIGLVTFSVLDSDGNNFHALRAVLDSDGNSFTVPKVVLDSDGNSFTVN
jgi:hypothetical protein